MGAKENPDAGISAAPDEVLGGIARRCGAAELKAGIW
jgi:hypothetical protein